MKIKVAFFLPELKYGGAQTMVTRLAKHIDSSKYDVRVFVRDSAVNSLMERELQNAGVSVTFLGINDNQINGSKIAHKYRSLRKICHVLNSFNPDIVHVHLDTFYAFLYCILCRKKLVFTVHSAPQLIASKRLKLFISLLEKRAAIKIIGCADIVSKEAFPLLAKNKSTVTTIYNPIEIEAYSKNQTLHDGFRYLHIGRLNPIKNQKMLISAFAGVLKSYPSSTLSIVGVGEEEAALQKLASTLEIKKSVCFMGVQDAIPKLMQEFDAFILSSVSECCPMTILEAMASGLAVVSTDVGGVRELVGNNAYLVKSNDTDALCEAMKNIQRNTIDRDAFIKNNIDRVKMFDARKIALEYEKIYDELKKFN